MASEERLGVLEKFETMKVVHSVNVCKSSGARSHWLSWIKRH